MEDATGRTDGPPEHPAIVRELGDATCRDLLATRGIGRLAFVADDGYPIALPVSYTYVDGRIWIRTGSGEKLSNAPLSAVGFEVDDLDPATRTGWSVVARGVAHWATPADGVSPDFGPAWVPGPFPARLVVKVKRLTGRRIDRS